MTHPDGASATSAKIYFTVGHSDRTLDEFIALLQEADVDHVVDVRRLPGSRKFPWFDQDELEKSLRDNGIGYAYNRELTGRRPRQHDVPPEVNGLWRNQSFHNYADWALTDDFALGLERLIADDARRPAVMCSEAVWWRCHRRIIADWLVGADKPVQHIMGQGHITPVTLTSGAIVHENGTVTYPEATPTLGS